MHVRCLGFVASAFVCRNRTQDFEQHDSEKLLQIGVQWLRPRLMAEGRACLPVWRAREQSFARASPAWSGDVTVGTASLHAIGVDS